MDRDAEDVSANVGNFGPASRQGATFLGKPGQGFGQQALANAWFERRHTGTHKAPVAAERMCETQTFVDLIQAYQEWASGAFEQIMADGLTCQQQIMAITGALGSPPLAPTATAKEGELRRSESRASTRSKTT
jgi:hypothetical protein